MIASILITALIASIVSGASAGAEPSPPQLQTLTFQATVHDTGSYRGFHCDFAGDECTKYKTALCEFIRQTLRPVQVPLTNFCSVKILSNRSVDNSLNVEVSIEFYEKFYITGKKTASADETLTSELSFKSSCSTFGGALKQAFPLLRNSPELNLQITKFKPEANPPTLSGESFTINVEGELFQNFQAVAASKWNAKDICAVRSQITNMNMDGDLLNVIYTYGNKTVRDFKVETDQNKVMVSFKIQYPKTFFEKTGINPNCDVTNNLQWGFTKPLSTKEYYLGGELTVENAGESAAAPTPVKKIPFEYTAAVVDDGSLDGQTCLDPAQPCLGYKRAVCKLAEKALLCGRLPPEEEVCSAVLQGKKAANGLEAKVSLQLVPDAEKLYPITEKCPTFGALYAQTYASYDVPTLNFTGFPTPKGQTPTTEELDKFQVNGTLMHNGEAVQWSTWTLEFYQNLEYTLSNFHMSDDVIQTFYRAKKSLTELKVNKKSEAVVAVSFIINYEKSYIQSAGIDPNCDLIGMLEWGFQNPEQPTAFTLGPNVTVTYLTNTATTQSTATSTEADATNTEEVTATTTGGGNVRQNSVLCLLIISLIRLLQHA